MLNVPVFTPKILGSWHMKNWIIKILFLSVIVAFGEYDATVTWEPSINPEVSTMRIYQIAQEGESIAGYSSFPYANLQGTFKLAVGCIEIYGRAYDANTEQLSENSNAISVPCVCPDCKGYDEFNDSPIITEDGTITGLDANKLTFQVSVGTTYEILGRPDLLSGGWVSLGSHQATADGLVEYPIDTTQHPTYFYKVQTL
jgi:hypothetical protein